MPRIMGVDLPNDKPTFVSLQYIFGVGKHAAGRVQHQAQGQVEQLRGTQPTVIEGLADDVG